MAAPLAAIALSITRGEARTFTGTHVTSATDTTPVNITGWTLSFTVRDANNQIVIQKAPSVVLGPTGTFSFSVTASDTTLSANIYNCDLWRTDAGNETVMGVGTFTILADVRV